LTLTIRSARCILAGWWAEWNADHRRAAIQADFPWRQFYLPNQRV